ncbi:uncharacterized protein VP01_1274g1 [Puccinia sorghi]|uniref:Uncharacterized protein n=1 Tax=Puccinia sorghi TaxID=27349 RepID=A0A0L6VNX1_9BASI|nr:uncharacterized protein VP01_1274g1 [Puccinia sorghi]
MELVNCMGPYWHSIEWINHHCTTWVWNAVQDILEGFQLSHMTKLEANLFDSLFNEVFNKYTQAAEEPESNESNFDLVKKI